MAKLPDLPKINIAGPFWTAEAEVIRLADPATNFTFRTLFADITPRQAVGQKDVLLPGTLLALVFVTNVTIRPTNGTTPQYVWKRSGGKPDGKLTPQAIRDAITTGKAALLLLAAPTDGWPTGTGGKLPTCTCLGGEIILDVMTAQSQAGQKLYTALGLAPAALGSRSGPANLLGALAVHASGLSAFGQIRLLWDESPSSAVFQLAQSVPDPEPTPGSPVRGFRMTIETERLTKAEQTALVDSWRRFNRFVNPNNPLNGLIEPVPANEWATLELANPLAIPRLFWQIAPWQEQPGTRPIHFAGDEFSLLLTDRQPYDPLTPPDTLARITPAHAMLTPDGTALRLDLDAGSAPAQPLGRIDYTASRAQDIWSESMTLGATTLAFDPNEAARQVRAALRLPEPEWALAQPPAVTQPLNPAVLWSFTPLEDGWAQLPLPNLSEQVYLDAAVTEAAPPKAQDNLLRGAVSYGNDDPAALGALHGEQPWSLTLAAARQMTATWRLERANGEYRVQSAQIGLQGPEVALSGLLWLSTAAPTAADALPNFDDWIGGLKTLALSTVTGRELFAPLVRLAFETLTFTRRTTPVLSADLGKWAFEYQVDATLLKTFILKKALPPDTLSAALPLVWRRHPTLPMVQALALTQSISPPNVPIPSRQLVPFELPLARQNDVDVPDGWRFNAQGAASWPRYGGAFTAAREWIGSAAEKLFDLPLVALSLPGLVLDPRPDGDAPANDATLGLPIQYRYDLPYTDEIQALAQLPKIPKDPRESSPLPDTPRPEPPRPLTRIDYATHWQRLAERANLASADSVAAFAKRDGQTVLRYLIALHDWPVRAVIALDSYPGMLTLDNADASQSAPLPLERDAALRGIDGRFADGTGDLRRLPNGTPADAEQYQITAGSMAAHRASTGGYGDQRGLIRAASVPGVNLIRTPVQHPQEGDVQLTTARAPLTLSHGASAWQLWFRDLPAQSGVFTKANARSSSAKNLNLDINDPEARSSNLEHRAGYEWRLRPTADDLDNPPRALDLFGLQFFPLVLDQVEFEDDGVRKVDLIGRLQLPIENGGEQTDLGNAVRLTFNGSGTSLTLSAAAIPPPAVDDPPLAGPPLGTPALDWPLALSSGEAIDAPRLRCAAIAVGEGGAALTVDQVQLHFFLFQVEWAITLPPIRFPNPQTPAFTLPQGSSPAGLVPEKILLTLDMATHLHQAALTLNVGLGGQLGSTGQPDTAGLQVLYTFDEGSGAIIHDRSNVGTPLDLTAIPATGISWGPQGLTVSQPTLIASAGPATKLIDACRASNAITIEAWVRPSSAEQGNPGRIATLSNNPDNRNVRLQQDGSAGNNTLFYQGQVRTKKTDNFSTISTPAVPMTNQLAHVVYVHSATGASLIYVNGVQQASGSASGGFSNWIDSYRLALANEFGGGREWLGDYRMLALYSRALSASEIAQRFAAGPTAALPKRQAFSATLTFNLMATGADRFTLDTARLFGDLALDATLPDSSPAALVGETTLQFAWQQYSAPETQKLQILPGMRLADAQTPGLNERAAPGFATISFAAIAKPNNLPDLPLTGGFLEALVVAHWGQSLQDGSARPAVAAASVFGSSAGDVVLGYTGRLQENTWRESFLVNGMLTVTNVVSWPQQLSYDPANARITLPAARTAAAPPLTHLRHTIRILLNQHELPAQILVSADGPLLFNFAEGQSWQPLALVEHQLVEVTPAADLSDAQLGREVRWAAVQEVRLLGPRTAAQFLRSLAALKTTDPVDGISPLGTASGGYLSAGLRPLLADPNAALDRLAEDTLLIEASAHHLIRLDAIQDATATTLQYLPTGSQGALLSSPQDYAPTDPADPRWLLLTTPFLGRLQDTERDLAEPGAGSPNPLQIDPLLVIARQRASAPTAALLELALAFSGWADSASLNVTFASFDTAVGRSFARLDPLSLEESWFRAQNPLPEPQAELLQSILATLPDTPARLSRSVALRQAFDPRRVFYPPELSDQPPLAEPSPPSAPVWRAGSLLLTQSVSTLAPTNKPPFGWTVAAALIASSQLFVPNDDAHSTRRYAAATLIPAPLKLDGADNPRPLSIVISPYLGIEWRPAPVVPQEGASPLRARLLVAELLCLAPGTAQLQPVASRMWSVAPDDQAPDPEQQLREQAQLWGQLSQPLLAPESPIAVLRYRIISDNTRPDTPDEAALTTGYGFALVTVKSSARLARQLFRIRAPLAEVRYREGQCNVAPVPQVAHDFELAPPQTIGVQPLYLTKRPPSAVTTPWPWGLSALRVSLRYTVDQVGVVGRAAPGEEGPTIWWQAIQRNVQFRSALHTSRPTGGLPRRFRAEVVRSLLPVLPDPQLPALKSELFDQPALPERKPGQADIEKGLELQRWQPVLPGGLRYLASGARAGVFVTLRNHLIRQSGITFTGETPRPRGFGMVSGGLPVQHRAPRPVPLPPNEKGREDVALCTWASYYAPTALCLVTSTPADEAFRAAFDDPPERPSYRQTPQRLRLQLAAPERYVLDTAWDGVLTFAYTINGEITLIAGTTSTTTAASIGDWTLVLELVDGQRVTTLTDITPATFTLTPALRNQLAAIGVTLPAPEVNTIGADQLAIRQFALSSDLQKRATLARSFIAAQTPGGTLQARIQALFTPQQPGAEKYHDGYRQTLEIPLRVADPAAPRLPLAPRYVHFEDPEYNRRLASPSAHASVIVQFPKEPGGSESPQRVITLAAERRECNPTSILAIRFDWDAPPPGSPHVTLSFQKIDLDQIPRDLDTPTPQAGDPPTFVEGRIRQISLAAIQQLNGPFVPGERLRIKLNVTEGPVKDGLVQLDIMIVEAPVIPATEAAYALLRKQTAGSQTQVECVRFAWGPEAQRVELVNPADLRTEVVRRRAVFYFTDAARPNQDEVYAVQKLSQSGSTHFPL